MKIIILILFLMSSVMADRVLVPKIVYSNPDTDQQAGALTLGSP